MSPGGIITLFQRIKPRLRQLRQREETAPSTRADLLDPGDAALWQVCLGSTSKTENTEGTDEGPAKSPHNVPQGLKYLSG